MSLELNDTELLDWITQLLRLDPPATTSITIKGKLVDGKPMYRFCNGPWCRTVRDAIQEHMRRYADWPVNEADQHARHS